MRELIECGQRNVRTNCQVENHAVTSPVFRDISDAAFDCLRGVRDAHVFSAKQNLAAVRRREPEDRPRQFRPATAHQSRQANNLTGAHRQINAVNS